MDYSISEIARIINAGSPAFPDHRITSLLTDSRYEVKALPRDILLAEHRKGGRRLTGLFSMGGQSSLVPVDAPDGLYPNLLDDSCRPIEVYGGMVRLRSAPIIFEWPAESV